ncbi:MAG: twin-arginine translocase subunit TatC [Thermoleophilia bacterium]
MTDHLTELRQRLMVSVTALLVGFAAAYVWRDRLLELLTRPLPGHAEHLVTLSPTEPFMTTLKVCLWAAVVVSVPVWIAQIYAFVAPAMPTQPRRVLIGHVITLSGLFLAGVAFTYTFVLPPALGFLLGFGGPMFNAQVRAGEYFSFVTTLLLAGGLVFEIPVAMAGLARLGVASAQLYRRQWRLAIVAIAALSAALPGGDPASMMLLMVPQLVLYAVGIALSSRVQARAERPWWVSGDAAPDS